MPVSVVRARARADDDDTRARARNRRHGCHEGAQLALHGETGRSVAARQEGADTFAHEGSGEKAFCW